MPLHRRKVYLDNSLSRQRRAENGLAFSIFVAAVVLAISLMGWLSDVVSQAVQWLLPTEGQRAAGQISAAQQTLTALTGFSEFMAFISAAYLILALFIRSRTRHGLE
jgi:hypothetical protein